MRIADFYPVIVTPHHKECTEFYRQWLGADTLFEASWFTLLHLPGEQGARLAFMAPDHPSTPPGAAIFGGEGLFLTLQVTDAAAEHARLEAAGAPITYPLTTEPWGQRRFALTDPAGTWLDVVEQVEPAPGFWDPYLTGA
jgi:uncharacterized glyoxalase superfamily protein PhnB